MIELTFLKELMLIEQVHQKVWCLSLLVFFKLFFMFQPNVCNRCHDLLMMSVNLGEIAVLNIKGSDYCCIISLISKKDGINLLQNADWTEKNETL